MDRAASRQSRAGSVANSRSPSTYSATASSSAALLGRWLYSDMAPVPSSAASRRMETALIPSRSISSTAVRTIRSRLSELPTRPPDDLDDVHRTCHGGLTRTAYVHG